MSVASAGMSDEQSTSQTLSGSVVPGDRSKPLRPAEMFQTGGHSEDRIAPSVERRDTIGQIRDAHRQRSWPGRRHHQTSLSATLALIQELPKMQAMDRNSRQIRGLTCEAEKLAPVSVRQRKVRGRTATMQAGMRKTSLSMMVVVALVLVLSGTVSAQSDHLLGTWRLNLAKSKYDPGPPPMSVTLVRESWDTDGIKEVSTVVLADGTHFTTEVSAHFDGKDYKFTTHPTLDTATLKRVTANTVTFTGKRGGKVVGTRTLVVSKNGR